jgi:hypothetical protein
MSEVVLVNRKGHPSNPIRINKDEMQKGDELYKEPAKKPSKKKRIG